MLIPSSRHTAEDLRLWSEYEDADWAWARRRGLQEKIDRAVAVIRSFAFAGPCYCGISAGKDSTVLAWLVHRSEVEIPLVHVRAGRFANPDNPAVLEAIGDVRSIDVEYDPDASEREKDRLFFEALGGCGDRYLSGIRADESGGRKIRMRRHGPSTDRTCAPLGWWSAQDVFAVHALHGLPTHPAYGMLGGGRWRRRNIRVDELAGERGSQFGRAEWEQEYYADHIRRIR